jgi:antitoxin YefM
LRGQEKLAILLSMTAAEHVPLAEVKNRLSEVVDRLEREHGRVVITKHGRPAAVMLSLDDLESLEETLAVLSDPGLMAAIAEADAEVAAGNTTRLSEQEALAEIER